MELENITCLVTGANRGIGRAITEALAQHPVRVLAGVRDVAAFPALEHSEALEVRPVRMDLGSFDSIEASVAGLGPELDRIDLLINNAGEFTSGQFEQQDLACVYSMVQANLLGTMHLTHRVLPGMLRRDTGKIVNTASIAGYLFVPGISSYAATKGGVVGFSECLGRELHDTGVSVLELITGGVDTDMLAGARHQLDEHYATDTDGWIQYTPDEWAGRVIEAILADDDVLGPGGKSALAKLATRGPRWLLDNATARVFSRHGG